jgi:hypothetical protein
MAYNLRKVLSVATSSQTLTFDHDNGSEVIVFVTNAGATTINLPNSTGFASRVLIKRMNGAGGVTVQPASGTIDGSASISLSAAYKFIEVVADGSGGWATIGSN